MRVREGTALQERREASEKIVVVEMAWVLVSGLRRLTVNDWLKALLGLMMFRIVYWAV